MWVRGKAVYGGGKAMSCIGCDGQRVRGVIEEGRGEDKGADLVVGGGG